MSSTAHRDYTNQIIAEGALRLFNVIGRGGYGTVYRAQSIFTGNYYAVKVLSKVRKGRDVLSQCLAEDKLHYRVAKHPHVLSLLTTLEDEHSVFLVTDYHSQGDLHTAVAENEDIRSLLAAGPDGVKRADEYVRTVFTQLIDAVDYCHYQGVYHRDLKLENVLISDDGNILLCDFGLATETDVAPACGLGSLEFIAPELMYESAQDQCSAKFADIWSMGIMLCMLASGYCPWALATTRDRSFRAYLAALPYHDWESCIDPKSWDFTEDDMASKPLQGLPMSAEARALVLRCLKINPRERISLADMRREIERTSTFFDVSAPPSKTYRPWMSTKTFDGLSSTTPIHLVTPPVEADITGVPWMSHFAQTPDRISSLYSPEIIDLTLPEEEFVMSSAHIASSSFRSIRLSEDVVLPADSQDARSSLTQSLRSLAQVMESLLAIYVTLEQDLTVPMTIAPQTTFRRSSVPSLTPAVHHTGSIAFRLGITSLRACLASLANLEAQADQNESFFNQPIQGCSFITPSDVPEGDEEKLWKRGFVDPSLVSDHVLDPSVCEDDVAEAHFRGAILSMLPEDNLIDATACGYGIGEEDVTLTRSNYFDDDMASTQVDIFLSSRETEAVSKSDSDTESDIGECLVTPETFPVDSPMVIEDVPVLDLDSRRKPSSVVHDTYSSLVKSSSSLLSSSSPLKATEWGVPPRPTPAYIDAACTGCYPPSRRLV